MKKLISLIISVIIMCGVNGIGNAFTTEPPTFEENGVVNNSVEKVQEDKSVVEKSDLSKEQVEETSSVSSSETEKSEERVSESIKTEEIKKVEEKPQVKEKTNQPQSSIEKTQEQSNVQKNEVEKQTENVEKDNPWDSLGITEYDFYNKPAHSWAEVDFKKSDYGSEEKTHEACEKYRAESGVGTFCLRVNSYSGDYLGEDLDFY